MDFELYRLQPEHRSLEQRVLEAWTAVALGLGAWRTITRRVGTIEARECAGALA